MSFHHRAPRRWLAVLAIAVALVSLAAGCARRPPAPPQTQGAYPITLTDDAGRTVTIAKRPERIISYASSNTEILYAIGAQDRLVGVDNFSDFPAEAQSLPKVGDLNPNYEQIVALKPDLILMQPAEAIVAKMTELGLTVYVVGPKTFDEAVKSIETVGRLVGAEEKAGEVAESMRRQLAEIQQAVGGIPNEQRVKVFYQVDAGPPPWTAGPGSFIDDLIRLAGGANVFSDLTQPWAEVSVEAIVQRAPDVVIATNWDSDFESLKNGTRPGWGSIPAVKNGRVYQVDANLVSRPGPRLVEGLRAIARALYPDRIK